MHNSSRTAMAMEPRHNARPDWSQALWQELDRAVLDEIRTAAAARNVLPNRAVSPTARTVPTDRFIESDRVSDRSEATDGGATSELGSRLAIDEAPVIPLLEIWAEFTLTRQQVQREAELGTALTLARQAAYLLAQAEDALILRGTGDVEDHPLFAAGRVRRRPGTEHRGLLATLPAAVESLVVRPAEAGSDRFGEATYSAVAQGYCRLQDRQHRGPFALILPPGPFADTQAALPATLLRPAERIEALLRCPIAATGDLPPRTGLLLSTGGASLELVVGQPPTVAFLFEDERGFSRFRVWERFALRVKDPGAVMPLEFLTNQAAGTSSPPLSE